MTRVLHASGCHTASVGARDECPCSRSAFFICLMVCAHAWFMARRRPATFSWASGGGLQIRGVGVIGRFPDARELAPPVERVGRAEAGAATAAGNAAATAAAGGGAPRDDLRSISRRRRTTLLGKLVLLRFCNLSWIILHSLYNCVPRRVSSPHAAVAVRFARNTAVGTSPTSL